MSPVLAALPAGAALAPHAAALAVVVPMLAAPLAVLFGSRNLAFALTLLAMAASALFSLDLLLRTVDGTVLSYHMGGWAPPLGIEYRVDAANAFVLLVVSTMGLVMTPYARRSIGLEIEDKHAPLFYACLLLCFTGLMGVTVTGDAFNIFVFLEISSLSTYVLVALGAKRDKRALSAAYDYLVMGTIGATFFVIGLGLLYMATGTLNLADLSARIQNLGDNRTVQAAFAFVVVGMGLKAAIFPVHRWLPGAYAHAPSVVTAFLAATATKVAIYVILRFVFSVYSPGFDFARDTLQFIVAPLAVAAMFVMSLIAIYQVDVKRLLAFSSVAQVGYMLLGMALLTETGVAAAIVHMLNHALTKGALFLAVGAVVYRLGSSLLPDMAGLGRRMPFTSAAMVVGGLSLIGVPATAGFVSKWVLLQAALEQGWWPVALLIVLSSLLAVIYVWRIVETLYLRPPPADAPMLEAPMSLLVPTFVLLAATVYLGLDAEGTIGAARAGAEALLAGGFGGADATVIGPEGR